jgi:hypothetical protein
MARVVRRRKNPLLPVLLIFVFLFLIAAVMATLSYNSGQEDSKAKKAEIAKRKKIISNNEMKISAIKQILDQHTNVRNAPTVVAELSSRIAELTTKVTGTKATAASAIKQIEDAIGQDTFLLNAIKTSLQAGTAESEKAAKLDADLKTLTASQQDAVAAYKALDEQFKTKATALAAEVQAITATKTTMVTEHAAALKANDATWQEKVTKQEQEVDTRIAQVSQLTVDKDKLSAKIVLLTTELRIKKRQMSIDLAVREAGKIKELMPNRKVCFIPLGTRDRIVRGMTFRVYGPEGIPSDGAGHKAALTVIRVFKTISQCRVTPVRDDDPIAIGDPFANIAFDPSRQPLFVVEGRFDLTGVGRLTDAGTQEVISLIKRSGGKVADKLTVDVDFVVMGPQPSKPPELPEDSPGPVKKAHEIRMAEFDRWKGTLDKAITLNVPKLNTRRFLTLTGYDTVKEYTE